MATISLTVNSSWGQENTAIEFGNDCCSNRAHVLEKCSCNPVRGGTAADLRHRECVGVPDDCGADSQKQLHLVRSSAAGSHPGGAAA